jgi:hypothetical protein
LGFRSGIVDGGLELIEIAPGIDLEREVLRHMALRPRIAPGLKLMDKRLLGPAPMHLRADLRGKARMGGGKSITGRSRGRMLDAIGYDSVTRA